MSYVPTRFVWRFGGRQVHLCGSFTRWVETVPMSPVEGSPSVFAVVVHLPPGYHQYKFIIDGRWRHDESAPFMPDPLGNVNNWLFVRRIEAAPNSLAPQPYEQQQQQHQQQLLAQQQQQQQQIAASVPTQQQHLLAQAQLHPAQHPALRSNGPGIIAAAAGAGGGGGSSGAPSSSPAVGAGASMSNGGAGPSLSHPVLNHQHVHSSISANSVSQLPVKASSTPAPAASAPEVDMANAADSAAVVAPMAIHNPKEPEYTRKKVADFLHNHTAYELIPESGKVVVLDMDLPVRQAFHALHEQGIASAPLWDSEGCNVTGVISASDFINILKRLRNSVSASGNPMSEQEMDAHTIRGLREQMVMEGRDPKPLVYVRPDDHLARVVRTLSSNKCSLAPIVCGDPSGSEGVVEVLHLATLSAVLACLMRHFRASLASLPLLAQPLSSLPLGTWAPDALGAMQPDMVPDGKDTRRQWRRIMPLHTVTASTPLTQALGLLLDAGVSALPVVDEQRCLVDVYARGDITALARSNAYNRLQWEDVTVGQALSLASAGMQGSGSGVFGPGGSNPTLAQHPAMGGLSAELHAAHQRQQQQQQRAALGLSGAGGPHGEGGAVHVGPGPGGHHTRVHACSKDDTLRMVVEKLAIPGVRRLVVVQPETRRVEGVISLSDVAAYLFL